MDCISDTLLRVFILVCLFVTVSIDDRSLNHILLVTRGLVSKIALKRNRTTPDLDSLKRKITTPNAHI